ncbi:MAG: NUDIX domain-containing protein [Planctomycetaceae bacterium]
MTAVRQIGIAVVQHAEFILVGTRPAGAPLAGYAEFPGGKCDPGEPPSACAIRECVEETALTVEPVRQLATIPWSYPHGDVELHFWQCRCIGIADQSPPPAPSPPFHWLPRQLLRQEQFPPANAAVLDLLLANTPVLRTTWAITVRFFAAAHEIAGTDTWQLTVPANSRLETVQSQVLLRHPNLRKYASSLFWAVNNQYADGTAPLHNGAVIACFPPVSGG